jgi:ABC-type polysaccharide/polyol phosphate export permease
MMTILWIVFVKGLKVGEQNNVNFVSWFFTANIPWLFLNEAINGVTAVYHEYAFLVKKVSFRLPLLPLVKILSALCMHLVFVVILVFVLIFNGIFPSMSWIGLFYYLFAAVVLLFCVGWLLAVLNIFMRDVGQLVSIMTQFLFWMTPIVWNADIMPAKWSFLLLLNPIFYITEGYRDVLLSKKMIWEQNWLHFSIFWTTVLLFGVASLYSYKRLRRHFADLLK